jgi:hypothetical protein
LASPGFPVCGADITFFIMGCIDGSMQRRGIVFACLVVILLLSSTGMGAEKIDLLLLVQDSRIDNLKRFFGPEPSVRYTVVVTYNGMLADSELLKLIRLYFPRRYEDYRKYEVVLLAKPEYELITTKQDKWIHDGVFDGGGGINDGSVFSQIAGIPEAWSSGLAWQAFPNDAPAVTAGYAAWAPVESYAVEINKDHPEPILTVFVPFGVEKALTRGVSRVVIPRGGSSILAWQVGNYPTKQPYLTAWEYGSGRSMTIGNPIPGGWLAYPTGATGQNQYSPEILMNMIYWLASTELIDDVEVFHSVKMDFAEYNERLKVLISLRDFIDNFGANTERIQKEMIGVQEIYTEASRAYLEHSFVDSQISISSALTGLSKAEDVARREKDKALIWVYVIEWLVSSSALFVSGFILWTLMVRRRLYRAVEMTKLNVMDE